MNDKKSENIVEMANYKTMNKIDTGSLQLLNECRDLMTDRLSNALSVMLNIADDVLFDLVQKSGPAEHHFYFNAMREVRLKRTSIESEFKENFANLYNNAIRSGTATDHHTGNTNQEKEIDIEETIALNSTVGKIRHDCHEALFTLDQRMGELLSSVKVEKRHNPIRPETVCTAFQEACRNIDSGIEIKLILFKLFEKYVAGSLHAAYTDIDSLLNEKKANVPSRPASNSYAQSEAVENLQKITPQNSGIIKDKNYFIVANRVIRGEITQHLGKASLPEFIRDFFFNHWSKLLLKIYIKEGVDSKAWLHAIEVIDDMIICIGKDYQVSGKPGAEPSMPNLIQRLKFGMNVIPVASALREEFLSGLKQYHQELLDMAKQSRPAEKQAGSEDITEPSYRNSNGTNTGKMPFMDELLVDNKPGIKKDFDTE